ncbi:MAG: M48 family metalloprotease [Pseudomonadota bacterium]
MTHHLLSRSHKFVQFCLVSVAVFSLMGCETNQATGTKKFTGLMPTESEAKIGADAHKQNLADHNGAYDNPRLQAYVNEVGQRLVKNTERGDVIYTFTVLNSPEVNAFAMPGGYVYLTRGIVGIMNSEAELAAVMGHEIGHVTARHGAERYSRGTVTSIGTTILGAVIGDPNISTVVQQGAGLWLKSYSRTQETEADTIGMRYLVNGGYDPNAMPSFFYTMRQVSEVNQDARGGKAVPEFMQTHPLEEKRETATRQLAAAAPKNDRVVNRDRHLDLISGMVYGDPAEAGFVRGNEFIHPVMGFKYRIPDGFRTTNAKDKVISKNKDGALVIFDTDNKKKDESAVDYMTEAVLKSDTFIMPQAITIGGMPAAIVEIPGKVGGQNVKTRLVAVEWAPQKVVRFKVQMPNTTPLSVEAALKETVYSLRRLSDKEKEIKPTRIRIVTAKAGDTAESLSQAFPSDTPKAHMFLALNGMTPMDQPIPGQRYKIIAPY